MVVFGDVMTIASVPSGHASVEWASDFDPLSFSIVGSPGGQARAYTIYSSIERGSHSRSVGRKGIDHIGT